jgi:hypothetical protein
VTPGVPPLGDLRPDQPSWQTVAIMLSAATVYE